MWSSLLFSGCACAQLTIGNGCQFHFKVGLVGFLEQIPSIFLMELLQSLIVIFCVALPPILLTGIDLMNWITETLKLRWLTRCWRSDIAQI